MHTARQHATDNFHLHQRLSIKSQNCTVRYIGAVDSKDGEWLGVEWDDVSRGKHDGVHDGKRYFRCRSRSSTAASFLRPSQTYDTKRTFLQALEDKYFKPEESSSAELIYVSRSKQFEEVGFDKFAKRQAELRGIHVLVLRGMRIGLPTSIEDQASIKRICSNISDLDLSGNLFEHLTDIVEIISLIPSLGRVTLDDNRFDIDFEGVLPGIQGLSLNSTLLEDSEISRCCQTFPALQTLELKGNELLRWSSQDLPHSLTAVDLAENCFSCIQDLAGITSLPQLKTLKLKNNAIESIMSTATESVLPLSSTIAELDLGYNQIKDWRFFNELPEGLPALKSLRVSGNPLYTELTSAFGRRPLTTEDGFMLTVARLPQVDTLNFSNVREADRLNAEKYYLGEIAAEASMVGPGAFQSIVASHPRWQDLCNEYGKPNIIYDAGRKIDPNSLAARLVNLDIHCSATFAQSRSWTMEVPRALNVYALYGLVAGELGTMPLYIKLIWESGERDPVRVESEKAGPEWWDSSDDDDDQTAEQHANAWTMRDVPLVPSTRHVGTFFEGQRASIRVELVSG